MDIAAVGVNAANGADLSTNRVSLQASKAVPERESCLTGSTNGTLWVLGARPIRFAGVLHTGTTGAGRYSPLTVCNRDATASPPTRMGDRDFVFLLAAAFLAATKPGLLKQRAAGQGPPP
jgi:hypothetical protein